MKYMEENKKSKENTLNGISSLIVRSFGFILFSSMILLPFGLYNSTREADRLPLIASLFTTSFLMFEIYKILCKEDTQKIISGVYKYSKIQREVFLRAFLGVAIFYAFLAFISSCLILFSLFENSPIFQYIIAFILVLVVPLMFYIGLYTFFGSKNKGSR